MAGSTHACAIRVADLSIVCWGSNSVGQAPAVPISGPFASMTAGASFACAVRYSDGALVCWGSDPGSYIVPPPAGAFVSASVGGSFGCAVRTDLSTKCWGYVGFVCFVSPGSLAFGPPIIFAAVIHSHGSRVSKVFVVVCRCAPTNLMTGPFVMVSASYCGWCALRASDGKVQCANNLKYVWFTPRMAHCPSLRKPPFGPLVHACVDVCGHRCVCLCSVAL